MLTMLILLMSLIHMKTVNAAANPTDTEVLNLPLTNKDNINYIDNNTELIDGYPTGDCLVYIDTDNGLVLTGDNSYNSIVEDVAIGVLKGYHKDNSRSNYLVLPDKYKVALSFNIGSGYFYLMPRFENRSYTLEVMFDPDNDEVDLNEVTRDGRSLVDSWNLGFDLQRNEWYNLDIIVYPGNTLNIAIENPSTGDTDSFSIGASSTFGQGLRTGLAFKAYDKESKFYTYITDLSVNIPMYVVGVEPDETTLDQSWAGGDLDFTSMSIGNISDMLFIKIEVAKGITYTSSGETGDYLLYFDVDKDSRFSSSNTFNSEHEIDISLTSNDAGVSLDSSEPQYLNIFGGGVSTTYWVIELPVKLLDGAYSFYIMGTTQDSGTKADTFPYDNTGKGMTGDYYIWYSVQPKPTSDWAVKTDQTGDAADPIFDITSMAGANSDNYMYFNFTINGLFAYYSPSTSKSNYTIFIDIDNDPSTGYPIKGVGAEYRLTYISGFAPVLYKYTGTSGEWKWSFKAKEDYIYNPGNEHILSMTVPKTDLFSGDPANITAQAFTYKDTDMEDYQDAPTVVPVPEFSLLLAITVLVIVLLVYKKHI